MDSQAQYFPALTFLRDARANPDVQLSPHSRDFLDTIHAFYHRSQSQPDDIGDERDGFEAFRTELPFRLTLPETWADLERRRSPVGVDDQSWVDLGDRLRLPPSWSKESYAADDEDLPALTPEEEDDEVC